MSWLSEKTRSFSNFLKKKALSYARYNICEQHTPVTEQSDGLDRMIYAVNPVYLEISPENRADTGKVHCFLSSIPILMTPLVIFMLWFLIIAWPMDGSHFLSILFFSIFALMGTGCFLSVWYLFSLFFHPVEHFIRFDRKRQKVFFMPRNPFEINTTPCEERPILEIPWENIRLATCQYKYAVRKVYHGQLLEVDATGKVIRTIDISKFMPDENKALLPLETIRRYMEEDYAPIIDSIRPKRWRQFCRQDWREIFSSVGVYPNTLDYPGNSLTEGVNKVFSHFFSILEHPYLFFMYFFNWLVSVLSPSPAWHKSIREMHEADLAELDVNIYGDPLEIARPQEQFKPNKVLWLLDKFLAVIAILVGFIPCSWFFFCLLSSDEKYVPFRPLSKLYFQFLIVSAIAAAIAHFSKSLKEKIRPNDNYWKPAVVKDTPQGEEKA